MASIDERLEKVQYLNNINIGLAERRWTGSRTIHWKNGEPMLEEENKKKQINLEK